MEFRNPIKEDTCHFMFRDFCQAHQQAPAADAGTAANLQGTEVINRQDQSGGIVLVEIECRRIGCLRIG
ncbi:MAG: hypothetical protein DMG76_33680 [Acidobacteria bacterium]|jgi:hypothetical protein|nr:MAG: hypothetical protein DMG76_33680 [Acidobacteriota bacterium]